MVPPESQSHVESSARSTSTDHAEENVGHESQHTLPGPSTESSDIARPTIAAAARSPTALSNLIASFIVLACFFLPHSTDCDKRTQRPVSLSSVVVADAPIGTKFFVSVVLWPYAFASGTIVLMMAAILTRTDRLERLFLSFPVAVAGILTLAWLVLLFAGRDGSRFAMMTAAVAAPTGTCVIARVWWLYRDGRLLSAAAWGQGYLSVLGAFSLRWFWFPPVSQLRWGGYLAIGGLLLMMVASWTWPLRAKHDLVDRRIVAQRFQISIFQIVLAVTLSAIALTYWRLFTGA